MRSPFKSLPTIFVDTQSILRHLDAGAVSVAAQRETRNREVHLPPISVYRWWARRTESVFGALVDAASKDFKNNRLLIADPFAGGGVIPLVAILRGHQVYAQDLNPWATFGLSAMLGLPKAKTILEAKKEFERLAKPLVHAAYATHLSDGTPAMVSYTFRVATASCSFCGFRSRLFPYAMVTLLVRKERKDPRAFLACPNGHLFLGQYNQESHCHFCGAKTNPEAQYTAGRMVTCQNCGQTESLKDRASNGAWSWEVVLVERASKKYREIGIPYREEGDQSESSYWNPSLSLGKIPFGQETGVLLRHGFSRWEDIYPKRQRAVTEALLDICTSVSNDEPTRNILRMAVLGTTEMAGLLSRWDRWYLKSYESMAGHRFNFTTLPAEPNVWGTEQSGRGTVTRRLHLFTKAASWFESKMPRRLVIEGPLSGELCTASLKADARVVEGSSERISLPAHSVDLVLTDPPYHDDVQYDELSLPLRAWAQLSVERLAREAVVNGATQILTKEEYRAHLASIFREVYRTLRPDGHLVLSYANREPEAWTHLFAALQEAGFRTAGFEIVHSENETDHTKRGVRACSLDLILDLVPSCTNISKQWTAKERAKTAEEEFLLIVGQALLQVGNLPEDWETDFVAQLKRSEFLLGAKSTEAME